MARLALPSTVLYTPLGSVTSAQIKATALKPESISWMWDVGLEQVWTATADRAQVTSSTRDSPGKDFVPTHWDSTELLLCLFASLKPKCEDVIAADCWWLA